MINSNKNPEAHFVKCLLYKNLRKFFFSKHVFFLGKAYLTNTFKLHF